MLGTTEFLMPHEEDERTARRFAAHASDDVESAGEVRGRRAGRIARERRERAEALLAREDGHAFTMFGDGDAPNAHMHALTYSVDTHTLDAQGMARLVNESEGVEVVLYKAWLPYGIGHGDMVCGTDVFAHRTPTAVFLCHGGAFAGAVFDADGKMCVHKTLRRYVVPQSKARGMRQSKRDGGKGTRHSAGAQARRYNEVKHEAEVTALLASWEVWTEPCGVVLLHAPAVNRAYFASLDPDVVHSVPVTARKCTLEEAKRVYAQVAMAKWYG